MAFNRELSQFASYLALDASARYIGITTAVDANVGIGSVTPKSKLDVVGDAFISGITTSTGGFVGDLTGTASNATQAETLTGTPSVTVNAVTSAHINNSGVVTSTGGFVGTLTGNADSATVLQTARNIGGVSFDGSSDINLPGVNAEGNQDTTGTAALAEGLTGTPSITVNTVTSSHINNTGVVTAASFVGDGSGLTGVASTDNIQTATPARFLNDVLITGVSTVGVVTGGTSVSATNIYGTHNGSVIGNVTGDVTGNADTATTLETARNIGGVSFDGSADINLPGVNISGNQDTSGNAATATALETARTIGGVSFDGSTNINLPGVNAAGNQDTSGNAATATALETARDFTASGDATASAASFDGTGNVDLALTLANSGVTAATYGGAAEVPVLTVDAKGRITSATTTAVGSALTVTGDSGSEDIDLLSESLAITGGTNLTSSAASNGVELSLDADVALTNLSASGVVTATSFKTGTEGSSIHINSATITGPSSITLDPAGIGDNTGVVHILGDLQVEGTTTTIDSTTVNIADKNIQVGTGAVNDAAADGAGFTIDSGDGDKTFQYENTGDNFGSSENMNLATGKVYKVNNVEVLSATTLGSNVVNSSLTSVGTLDSLNVAGAITGDNLNLSGIVTASSFVATEGTMNITGNVTGTATTATNAEGLTGTPSIEVQDITGNGNINITGVVTATRFFGDLTGNVTGDVTGTATTATDAVSLQTARNIGGVSFDGTADINLPGVNQTGNQDTSGNAATATALETARTIGGVSFDGSTNINLPGVNQAGNQDTSGNAATATALETARNFSASGDASASAVSFDGSGNVDLALTLANSGVSAATYGSESQVSQITVDSKGRITSAANVAISTSLQVFGGSGSGSVNLLVDGLQFIDGTYVNTSVAGTSVTIGLDATSNNTADNLVARDGSGNFSAGTISAALTGNVTGDVTGDLTGDVTGNVTGDVTGNADTATLSRQEETSLLLVMLQLILLNHLTEQEMSPSQ